MVSQEKMKSWNRSEAGSSGNGHEERDSWDISEIESTWPRPKLSNFRNCRKQISGTVKRAETQAGRRTGWRTEMAEWIMDVQCCYPDECLGWDQETILTHSLVPSIPQKLLPKETPEKNSQTQSQSTLAEASLATQCNSPWRQGAIAGWQTPQWDAWTEHPKSFLLVPSLLFCYRWNLKRWTS